MVKQKKFVRIGNRIIKRPTTPKQEKRVSLLIEQEQRRQAARADIASRKKVAQNLDEQFRQATFPTVDAAISELEKVKQSNPKVFALMQVTPESIRLEQVSRINSINSRINTLNDKLKQSNKAERDARSGGNIRRQVNESARQRGLQAEIKELRDIRPRLARGEVLETKKIFSFAGNVGDAVRRGEKVSQQAKAEALQIQNTLSTKPITSINLSEGFVVAGGQKIKLDNEIVKGLNLSSVVVPTKKTNTEIVAQQKILRDAQAGKATITFTDTRTGITTTNVIDINADAKNQARRIIEDRAKQKSTVSLSKELERLQKESGLRARVVDISTGKIIDPGQFKLNQRANDRIIEINKQIRRIEQQRINSILKQLGGIAKVLTPKQKSVIANTFLATTVEQNKLRKKLKDIDSDKTLSVFEKEEKKRDLLGLPKKLFLTKEERINQLKSQLANLEKELGINKKKAPLFIRFMTGQFGISNLKNLSNNDLKKVKELNDRIVNLKTKPLIALASVPKFFTKSSVPRSILSGASEAGTSLAKQVFFPLKIGYEYGYSLGEAAKQGRFFEKVKDDYFNKLGKGVYELIKKTGSVSKWIINNPEEAGLLAAIAVLTGVVKTRKDFMKDPTKAITKALVFWYGPRALLKTAEISIVAAQRLPSNVNKIINTLEKQKLNKILKAAKNLDDKNAQRNLIIQTLELKGVKLTQKEWNKIPDKELIKIINKFSKPKTIIRNNERIKTITINKNDLEKNLLIMSINNNIVIKDSLRKEFINNLGTKSIKELKSILKSNKKLTKEVKDFFGNVKVSKTKTTIKVTPIKRSKNFEQKRLTADLLGLKFKSDDFIDQVPLSIYNSLLRSRTKTTYIDKLKKVLSKYRTRLKTKTVRIPKDINEKLLLNQAIQQTKGFSFSVEQLNQIPKSILNNVLKEKTESRVKALLSKIKSSLSKFNIQFKVPKKIKIIIPENIQKELIRKDLQRLGIKAPPKLIQTKSIKELNKFVKAVNTIKDKGELVLYDKKLLNQLKIKSIEFKFPKSKLDIKRQFAIIGERISETDLRTKTIKQLKGLLKKARKKKAPKVKPIKIKLPEQERRVALVKQLRAVGDKISDQAASKLTLTQLNKRLRKNRDIQEKAALANLKRQLKKVFKEIDITKRKITRSPDIFRNRAAQVQVFKQVQKKSRPLIDETKKTFKQAQTLKPGEKIVFKVGVQQNQADKLLKELRTFQININKLIQKNLLTGVQLGAFSKLQKTLSNSIFGINALLQLLKKLKFDSPSSLFLPVNKSDVSVLMPIQRYKTLQLQKIKQVLDQEKVSDQVKEQSLKQLSQLSFASLQALDQKKINIIVNRLKTSQVTITKPTRPRKFFNLNLDKKPPKGFNYIFDIRIRVKGKPKTIEHRKPINSAFNRSGRAVDNSLSRSAELVLVGISKQKDVPLSKELKKKFRLKKLNSKALRMVELRKHALDKPGEKQRIQLEKLLKPKTKKKNKTMKKKTTKKKKSSKKKSKKS